VTRVDLMTSEGCLMSLGVIYQSCFKCNGYIVKNEICQSVSMSVEKGYRCGLRPTEE
jgi:hypothetical protein